MLLHPRLAACLTQQKPARLRRKGPVLWIVLALLVLAADFLLAYLAWLAVDFGHGHEASTSLCRDTGCREIGELADGEADWQ